MHSIQHYFVVVATGTFLLLTTTLLDVQLVGVVHGISLVSSVVHHGSKIRLRWRNSNSVRNNDNKSNTNSIKKKKKTIDTCTLITLFNHQTKGGGDYLIRRRRVEDDFQ
mmetsp:Transcript_9960/g.9628  ORF Transcript_9960/g.9628 Transcript_9960/m.9628 type:complete len:109 (+) Transcript_9960:139-465(+)